MKLHLNVIADENDAYRIPRVFFLQNNVTSNVYSKVLTLTQSQPTDLRLTVFLEETKSLVRPITFDFEYTAVTPNYTHFNNTVSIVKPEANDTHYEVYIIYSKLSL